MKKLLIVLLLIGSSCTFAIADLPVREYPGWKNSDRFAISNVSDFKDAYDADEPIAFYVEGQSDKMIAGQASGFNLQAVIHEVPRSNTVRFAIVNRTSAPGE